MRLIAFQMQWKTWIGIDVLLIYMNNLNHLPFIEVEVSRSFSSMPFFKLNNIDFVIFLANKTAVKVLVTFLANLFPEENSIG